MPLQSEVVIYTDGACEPNPGTGGWAAILLFEQDGTTHSRELSGGEKDTTNNRMEIMAVLKSLQTLKRPCFVTIYSDSKYVVNSVGSWLDGSPRSGHHGWMVGWQRHGWTKKDGPLKNVDLWKLLHAEVRKHKGVCLNWIRGHAGHEYNDRCDFLAVEARRMILDGTLPSDGLQQEGTPDNPDDIGIADDGSGEGIQPTGTGVTDRESSP